MAVDLRPLLLYLDFTKSAAEIIVELINYCNGTSLTSDMLTYKLPPTVISGNHNTVVEATATPTSPYEGMMEVTYNRIDLGELFESFDKFLVADSGARYISDIIPLVNAKYKLNLTRDDYLDGPLPDSSQANPETGSSFVLKANPRSLIFIGQVSLSVTNNETTPTLEQNCVMRTYIFQDAMPLHIKHNMNSVDFIESIRGVDNRRIYANVVVINEMEILVEFTEPESGRITIAFGINT